MPLSINLLFKVCSFCLVLLFDLFAGPVFRPFLRSNRLSELAGLSINLGHSEDLAFPARTSGSGGSDPSAGSSEFIPWAHFQTLLMSKGLMQA